MKVQLKRIITLFVIAVFIVFSTGIVVTIHHCCNQHHHGVCDHSHCHDELLIIKITDQYNISSFNSPIHLIDFVYTTFFVEEIERIEENLCLLILKESVKIPPLPVIVGLDCFELIHQRVFYC